MARTLPQRLKYLFQRSVLGLVARLLPRLEWAQFHLGNAHAEHGFAERALGPWTRACAKEPLRAAAAINLASTHLERGELDPALPVLERLTRDQPSVAPGWALLGKVQQKRQAFAEAVAAYQWLLALEPRNDTVRLTTAVLLEKLKRPDEALACYRAVRDPALQSKAEQRIRALSPRPPASP